MSIACQPRLFGLPQQELTSDDYYTPAWVFERMGISFDLDVCAPPGGIDWIPAARYFTQEDDGLAQEWSGRVWMNPPYSNTTPWADRFIAHRNGVALVPHSRSAWWGRLWDAADGIADAGMFRFLRAADLKLENVFMPVVFAAFGDECVEAIGRLGVVRRIA
jgi:hypothetical protein